MTNFQKWVVGLGIVVALLFSVTAVSTPSTSTDVGGVYSNVVKDFSQGITVDGKTIITGNGALYVKDPVLTPTADTTLTVEQSGSIVQMGVAGLDITLPVATVSAGVGYKFVVSQAVATTNMTIVGAPADIIEGTLIVAGAVVDCDAVDALNFVIDGENIGDYVELYSDGTKWMIGDSGVLTSAKLTCTG